MKRKITSEKLSYALVETKAGWMGIVGSAAGLHRVTLPQASLKTAVELVGKESLREDLSLLGDLPQRLQRYFEGEVVSFPDRLDLGGASPFQQAAWEAMRSIPYGETRSYAWIACQAGKPGAARAAGQAAATNPLCIVVPCHRVIGSNGDLRGFGGGLEMEKCLLDMEANGKGLKNMAGPNVRRG